MLLAVSHVQPYDTLSTKTSLTVLWGFLLSMFQVFTFLQTAALEAVQAGCAV